MECFDTETLNMHLDNELEPQRQRAVAAHLSTCQECTAKLRVLKESNAMLEGAFGKVGATATSRPTCYGAEALSAYASGLLSLQEAQPVEQHLYTCDVCLREVMAIRRMRSVLHRGGLMAPPPRLVEAARREFAGVGRQETVDRLGTLIVQIAREGLRFLEAAFLPDGVRLAVGGHLIPAAAFRGVQGDTDAAALVDIRQSVRDLDLRLSAFHEDQESVLLRLQVRKQGRPLARRRVSLTGNGRRLYSSTTSEGGEVEFPRLTPGDYTIRLPQEHVETQIILRSSSGEGQGG